MTEKSSKKNDRRTDCPKKSVHEFLGKILTEAVDSGRESNKAPKSDNSVQFSTLDSLESIGNGTKSEDIRHNILIPDIELDVNDNDKNLNPGVIRTTSKERPSIFKMVLVTDNENQLDKDKPDTMKGRESMSQLPLDASKPHSKKSSVRRSVTERKSVVSENPDKSFKNNKTNEQKDNKNILPMKANDNIKEEIISDVSAKSIDRQNILKTDPGNPNFNDVTKNELHTHLRINSNPDSKESMLGNEIIDNPRGISVFNEKAIVPDDDKRERRNSRAEKRSTSVHEFLGNHIFAADVGKGKNQMLNSFENSLLSIYSRDDIDKNENEFKSNLLVKGQDQDNEPSNDNVGRKRRISHVETRTTSVFKTVEEPLIDNFVTKRENRQSFKASDNPSRKSSLHKTSKIDKIENYENLPVDGNDRENKGASDNVKRDRRVSRVDITSTTVHEVPSKSVQDTDIKKRDSKPIIGSSDDGAENPDLRKSSKLNRSDNIKLDPSASPVNKTTGSVHEILGKLLNEKIMAKKGNSPTIKHDNAQPESSPLHKLSKSEGNEPLTLESQDSKSMPINRERKVSCVGNESQSVHEFLGKILNDTAVVKRQSLSVKHSEDDSDDTSSAYSYSSDIGFNKSDENHINYMIPNFEKDSTDENSKSLKNKKSKSIIKRVITEVKTVTTEEDEEHQFPIRENKMKLELISNPSAERPDKKPMYIKDKVHKKKHSCISKESPGAHEFLGRQLRESVRIKRESMLITNNDDVDEDGNEGNDHVVKQPNIDDQSVNLQIAEPVLDTFVINNLESEVDSNVIEHQVEVAQVPDLDSLVYKEPKIEVQNQESINEVLENTESYNSEPVIDGNHDQLDIVSNVQTEELDDHPTINLASNNEGSVEENELFYVEISDNIEEKSQKISKISEVSDNIEDEGQKVSKLIPESEQNENITLDEEEVVLNDKLLNIVGDLTGALKTISCENIPDHNRLSNKISESNGEKTINIGDNLDNICQKYIDNMTAAQFEKLRIRKDNERDEDIRCCNENELLNCYKNTLNHIPFQIVIDYVLDQLANQRRDTNKYCQTYNNENEVRVPTNICNQLCTCSINDNTMRYCNESCPGNSFFTITSNPKSIFCDNISSPNISIDINRNPCLQRRLLSDECSPTLIDNICKHSFADTYSRDIDDCERVNENMSEVANNRDLLLNFCERYVQENDISPTAKPVSFLRCNNFSKLPFNCVESIDCEKIKKSPNFARRCTLQCPEINRYMPTAVYHSSLPYFNDPFKCWPSVRTPLRRYCANFNNTSI